MPIPEARQGQLSISKRHLKAKEEIPFSPAAIFSGSEFERFLC
jgi:hypothetical protein